MSRYLSLDTEATGLTESDLLIQLAVVPLDVETKTVHVNLGMETLVQCPSFESMKPKLNSWVIEHNEKLITEAHQKGVPALKLRELMTEYLDSAEIKSFFRNERPILLGKSMSALDIPLLTRTFGWEFMNQRFHHQVVDVTSVARFLVDAGHLPKGCESTSKIVKYFGIRENALHTALSDAMDMAHIYIKMVEAHKKDSSYLSSDKTK